MSKPRLELTPIIPFPGSPIISSGVTLNISQLTAKNGIVNPDDGDNGSDFCYINGGYTRQKFQGGGRAHFDGYDSTGTLFLAQDRSQEATAIAWSPSDIDPGSAIGIQTDPFGDDGAGHLNYSVAIFNFAAGALNCGVKLTGAPVTRDTQTLMVVGRIQDPTGNWFATASLADSSQSPITLPINYPYVGPNVYKLSMPFAFKVRYSSFTPTVLNFKTERVSGGGSSGGINWLFALITPTPKRKFSTGIRVLSGQQGVFGGARYA